ncbi:hypothetical protein GZH53_07900 [Flavihumibacter sp. R14]|nr:hypothetical protein [Flavihumibacter soli]
MNYDALVLTADIRGFTKLLPEKREELILSISDVLHSWVDPEFARIFRGDSIQMLFRNPKECLNRAIQLRCWLKKSVLAEDFMLDARLAFGIGKIDYYGDTVLDSDGEAFHLSGRAFDMLEPDEFMRIATSDEALNEQLNIIVRWVDIQIRDWTRGQAEVIYLLLENKTQQEMADELGVVQSAINNRLKLARWKDVERTIDYISSLLKHS